MRLTVSFGLGSRPLRPCMQPLAPPGTAGGNAERERHSLDSRGEPWSAAERLAHRILRAAGITGWTANHQVTAKFGLMVSRYYLDIAFPQIWLAIEIDGNAWHGNDEQLRHDRYRQNDLTGAGWTVLQVDWWTLTKDTTYFIALVRDAISAAEARLASDMRRGRA